MGSPGFPIHAPTKESWLSSVPQPLWQWVVTLPCPGREAELPVAPAHGRREGEDGREKQGGGAESGERGPHHHHHNVQ